MLSVVPNRPVLSKIQLGRIGWRMDQLDVKGTFPFVRPGFQRQLLPGFQTNGGRFCNPGRLADRSGPPQLKHRQFWPVHSAIALETAQFRTNNSSALPAARQLAKLR